jgi:hypothetical protein
LLLSTTTLSLHPDWGWPPTLLTFSEIARRWLDYEVLDERMIDDGGLEKLGIRMLALADAEYLPVVTLHKIADWVRKGGVLVSLQSDPVRDVAGSDADWKALAPTFSNEMKIEAGDDRDPGKLWSLCGRKVDQGHVLILAGPTETLPRRADLLRGMLQNLGSLIPGAMNEPRISPNLDGVFASLFADRILYYNSTDREVSTEMALREEDFKGAKPAKFAFPLKIAPHEIVAIPLK